MAVAPRITAQERQWMAQDNLRTLSSAARIQQDAKAMRDVKAEAARQIKTLSSAMCGGAKPAPAKSPAKRK